MTSLQIVQQIVTYHPCLEAGISRGWSYWYAGVHGGRGDWNYLNLIFAPENELKEGLEALIKEHYELGLEGLRWNEHLIRNYVKDEPEFLGIEIQRKDGSWEFIKNEANIKL